jgi:hypothetical protein
VRGGEVDVATGRPSARAAGGACLLLAPATLTRSIGAPLPPAALGYLAVTRIALLRFAVAAIAGLLPLVLYATRFRAENGTFALSQVDAASEYVWAPGSSLNRMPGGAIRNNDLARSFALHASGAAGPYIRSSRTPDSCVLPVVPVACPAAAPALTRTRLPARRRGEDDRRRSPVRCR